MSPIILLTVIFAAGVSGHFNLFIAQQEVKKLLGLSSELYYVRNGVVNSYAMNFEVPVPATVSQLEFFWQSLTRHPVPYAWSVETNNRQAMKRPTFNISHHGLLPTKVTAFNVRLECTGDVSAEVRVVLTLNVSAVSHRQNDTILTFKRNKVCLKAHVSTSLDTNEISGKTTGKPPLMVVGDSNNNQITDSPGANNNGTSGRVSSETDESNMILYVGLGVCCAIIAILLVILFNTSVVHTYLGTGKMLSRDSLQTSYTTAPYAANPSVFVRLAPSSRCGTYATISSLHKFPSSACNAYVSPYATSNVTGSVYKYGNAKPEEEHIYSKPDTESKISYYASTELMESKMTLRDPRLVSTVDKVSELKVARNCIFLQQTLQEGAFGRVYKAFFRRANANVQSVLVKTVTEAASDQQKATFLSEGTMLFDLKHVNILSVIAVNVDPYQNPLLVYPLPLKGNLKRYLQNCRLRDGEQYNIHTRDMINMAVQVAVAGVFLHTNGYYHKDIAARNCVLDDNMRVKVTDSALSRDLFPGDYHCLGDNENRPIKWLALESLVERTYSGASDVWSFGVLLWELMTVGKEPYEQIDPYEVEFYLKDGYRLSQPVHCPDDLFGMMTCCWLSNPHERPTFVQLLACLQDFQSTLGRFI